VAVTDIAHELQSSSRAHTFEILGSTLKEMSPSRLKFPVICWSTAPINGLECFAREITCVAVAEMPQSSIILRGMPILPDSFMPLVLETEIHSDMVSSMVSGRTVIVFPAKSFML